MPPAVLIAAFPAPNHCSCRAPAPLLPTQASLDSLADRLQGLGLGSKRMLRASSVSKLLKDSSSKLGARLMVPLFAVGRLLCCAGLAWMLGSQDLALAHQPGRASREGS